MEKITRIIESDRKKLYEYKRNGYEIKTFWLWVDIKGVWKKVILEWYLSKKIKEGKKIGVETYVLNNNNSYLKNIIKKYKGLPYEI